MKYLDGEEVLVIHSEILDETGGLHGIRDVGLFTSIIQKPKAAFGGKDLYEGIFTKSAVYFESFAKYHVFLDGNKRTAVASSVRFLYLNGFDFTATNKEIENFAVKVVTSKLNLESIAEWLKKHSKRAK